jgi:hypothetical protein
MEPEKPGSAMFAGRYIQPLTSNEPILKKIPAITVVLWLVMLFGYKMYPGFFLKGFIQYPLVVLLSILLPVSFWLLIQSGKRIYSLIFVGIFFINVAVLAFALESNFSAQRFLEKNSSKGIIPEIAEILSSDKNFDKSRLAARLIYQNHAVSVPFRTEERSFALYEPSQQDKETYRTNFARNNEIVVAGMNAMEQMLTTFFLLILHGGLFLLMLVFLLFYENEERTV